MMNAMDKRTPEERLRDAGGTTSKPNSVADFLSADAWLARDTPEPDRLVGDLVTTTSRTFLVGRTGLGKTLLGIGLACGIASSAGFLHWQCHRPARVLYIDGEMPTELIKPRLADAMRRVGRKIAPGNLIVFARDIEDEVANRFPRIGPMQPLNTEEGRRWLLSLIDAITEAVGKPDVIIFDNVMSLVSGDQREEISWSGALDLVQDLTKRRIGQIWLDHTGHNSDRQYGSSTKAWRFDSVGVMTPLPDDQRDDREVAFTLSFDHPGKARRRTPDNWRDFETRTIRLADDQWTSEATSKTTRAAPKLSETARAFYDALRDALATTDTPGSTTRTKWYAEAVRTGLAEAVFSSDDYKVRRDKQSKFRTYMARLKAAGMIGIDGETVRDLLAG